MLPKLLPTSSLLPETRSPPPRPAPGTGTGRGQPASLTLRPLLSPSPPSRHRARSSRGLREAGITSAMCAVVSSWPKSSFRFFHDVQWKHLNKLFNQSSIYPVPGMGQVPSNYFLTEYTYKAHCHNNKLIAVETSRSL